MSKSGSVRVRREKSFFLGRTKVKAMKRLLLFALVLTPILGKAQSPTFIEGLSFPTTNAKAKTALAYSGWIADRENDGAFDSYTKTLIIEGRLVKTELEALTLEGRTVLMITLDLEGLSKLDQAHVIGSIEAQASEVFGLPVSVEPEPGDQRATYYQQDKVAAQIITLKEKAGAPICKVVYIVPK